MNCGASVNVEPTPSMDGTAASPAEMASFCCRRDEVESGVNRFPIKDT